MKPNPTQSHSTSSLSRCRVGRGTPLLLFTYRARSLSVLESTVELRIAKRGSETKFDLILLHTDTDAGRAFAVSGRSGGGRGSTGHEQQWIRGVLLFPPSRRWCGRLYSLAAGRCGKDARARSGRVLASCRGPGRSPSLSRVVGCNAFRWRPETETERVEYDASAAECHGHSG